MKVTGKVLVKNRFMKYLLWVFLMLMLATPATAQRFKVDYETDTRKATIVSPDHVLEVTVLEKEKKVRINPERMYTWYKGNQVITTRGAIHGKVLHGLYTDLYTNKNLKEQGKYVYGLKKGTWNSWYDNGEKMASHQWKNGALCGTFKEYDKGGNLIRKGSYKNGEINGTVYTYNGDSTSKARYKDGKVQLKKVKEKKVKPAPDKKEEKTGGKDKEKWVKGERWNKFKNWIKFRKKDKATSKDSKTVKPKETGKSSDKDKQNTNKAGDKKSDKTDKPKTTSGNNEKSPKSKDPK